MRLAYKTWAYFQEKYHLLTIRPPLSMKFTAVGIFQEISLLRSIAESSHRPRETQLPADNTSFSLSPVVVTDGAPYAVVVDLNSTSSVVSVRQAYRVGVRRDV